MSGESIPTSSIPYIRPTYNQRSREQMRNQFAQIDSILNDLRRPPRPSFSLFKRKQESPPTPLRRTVPEPITIPVSPPEETPAPTLPTPPRSLLNRMFPPPRPRRPASYRDILKLKAAIYNIESTPAATYKEQDDQRRRIAFLWSLINQKYRELDLADRRARDLRARELRTLETSSNNTPPISIVPSVATNTAPANIYSNIPIVGERIVPENATNAITMEPFKVGNIMANFHGESGLGRYYSKNTFDQLRKKSFVNARKQNPMTRQPIEPGNVTFYKKAATPQKTRKWWQFGKRSTRKANRKSRKTRKSRK